MAGGKREGAGRRAIAPDARRIQTTISVRPDTKAKMRELSLKHKVRVGQIIDKVIDELYSEFSNEEIGNL